MRKIILLFTVSLLIFTPIKGQAIQKKVPEKLFVSLIINGHKELKPSISSFFKREIRSLGDVVLVDKNASLQIKIDGMSTGEITSKVQFVISIIILNNQGMFLANDLGVGSNSQDLKEIAQKIIAQVDDLFLEPLRKSENSIAHSSKPKKKKVYPSLRKQHWIIEKMDGGQFIRLEDNSLWLVSPYDRSTSELWLPNEELFIIETDDKEYPYNLLNKNNEDNVAAQLLSQ